MSDLLLGGNLVLPKTSGLGIKVDHTAPTYGWKDLLGPISPKALGVGSPTRTVYQGNIYDFAVIANDQIDFLWHMPHDWVPSSDMYIHVHHSHNGTNISGSVVWTCYISFAKGYNQENFPAEIAPTITYNTVDLATTPRYRHRIDEIQLSAASPSATQFNSANLEVDGLFLMTAKLTTAPTVTGGSWFVHYFDLHYQSTGMSTKQRTGPAFYT